MQAVILVATLKRGSEADKKSRTLKLARRLAEELRDKDVTVKLLRLADLDPANDKGPPPWTGVKKRIIDEILAADIVVFGTPIWWNNHSSLMQRVIEYLDDVNDQDLKKNENDIGPLSESSFAGKAFGCLVVGSEDGTQHIVGNLLNFAHWVGFTIPAMASVTKTQTPEEEVEAMVKRAAEALTGQI